MPKKKSFKWLIVLIVVVLFVSIPLTIVLVTKSITSAKYYYFGCYPQTLKAEDVQITSQIDSRGYYIGSDAEYYAKVNDKYYKVEPIKWRILKKNEGKALLLSEFIIDDMQFSTYSNNYENSSVRHWLNETFYDYSFSSTEKERIILTAVDNSVQSTIPAQSHGTDYDTDNPNTCPNTYDKVFLLSKYEVSLGKYGFTFAGEHDENREKNATDYAIARSGIDLNKYSYSNYWMLRSPDSRSNNYIQGVDDGYASLSCEAHTPLGIVPAIWIKMN